LHGEPGFGSIVLVNAYLPVDDKTFAALADTHRREILLALATRDADAAALDALAVVSPADAESLRLSLYHTHLPVLEAAGLVEWDRDGYEVARGPTFEEIVPILAVLGEDSGRTQMVA